MAVAGAGTAVRPARVLVRLPYRTPFAAAPLVRAIRAHSVPGLERCTEDGFVTRVVRAPGGPAVVRLWIGRDDGEMRAELRPAHPGDVAHLLLGLRRWLDLDDDPAVRDRALGSDPALAPLVAARPGLRVLGGTDAFEAAALVIMGQHVSLAAARTFAGRLVAAFGTPVTDGLSAFPTATALALAEPGGIRAAVGLTGARAAGLHALSEAVARGDLRLDPGADPATARAALLELPGVGPWTAECIALRALGDRDAYPAGDLVLRRALGGVDAREAEARAEAWRPWRAHALFHLWTHAAFPDPVPGGGATGRDGPGRRAAPLADGGIAR